MGRLKGRQGGFAVLEIVIVLVALGFIGGTAWYVTHRSQTALYKNSAYNFEFAYPKSWGAPQESMLKGETGSLYQLKWGNATTGGFATKDYMPDTSGSVVNVGPAVRCTLKKSDHLLVLYQSSGDGCAFTTVLGLAGKSLTQAELVAGKQFSAGSKLDSIEFAIQVRKDVKDVSQAALGGIYSKTEQQAAIDLTKSVKEGR